MRRVGPEATAFYRRDAGFVYNMLALWKDPAENELHTGWAKGAFEALRPVSLGGAYINFLGDDGQERVRGAYGPNYARLAELKGRYDPTNLFCLNQNIKPM